jgi:hypothetical protein
MMCLKPSPTQRSIGGLVGLQRWPTAACWPLFGLRWMRHDVSRALPYSKIHRRPRRPPTLANSGLLAFVWLALACIGLRWPLLAFVGLLVAS